jgi:gliding motility-associated-like protein
LLAIFCFVGCSSQLFAQKQNNQWRLGRGGAIDFNGPTPIMLPNVPRSGFYRPISLADRQTGALLFYSDGTTVWDANNDTMPNGRLLPYREGTDGRNGQVVPWPGNPYKYFVFYRYADSLMYSVVDMHLRGGLGDVVASEKDKILMRGWFQSFQSVPTCDRQGYWLVCSQLPNSPGQRVSFVAFEITAAGINTIPVISQAGYPAPGAHGYNLRVSHHFDQVALQTEVHALTISAFNNATGRVSYDSVLTIAARYREPPTEEYLTSTGEIHGIEFSPDDKLLYEIFGRVLLQFNLTLPTEILINESQDSLAYIKSIFYNFNWDMKYGGDGKIYLTPEMFCVSNPNGLGAASQVLPQTPDLVTRGSLALPNWIYDNNGNIILAEDSCAGSLTKFQIVDSIQATSINWDFDDPASGSLNAATGVHASHQFAQPGIYTVQATIVRSCGSSQVLQRRITILNCCAMANSPYALFDYTPNVLCNNQPIANPVKGSQFVSGGIFTGTAGLSINPITGSIDLPASNPGTYTISYTVTPTLCGALVTGTTSITIRVAPLPPVVQSPVSFCQHDPPSTLSGTGSSLHWYTSSTDTVSSVTPPVIDSSQAGTDTVFVTQSVNGCSSNRAPIVVSVWPRPQVHAGGPYVRINPGEQAQLQGTVTPAGLPVTWQPGGFNILQPLVSPAATTIYRITAIEPNGCNASDSIRVIVTLKFHVPNVFTPNGDGVNDNWEISNLDGYPGLKLDVFNRWGQSIYSWREGGRFWDGTFNGKPVPAGSYYWVIDPGSGFPIQKGFVDLLR